jgi:hypothetical protein
MRQLITYFLLGLSLSAIAAEKATDKQTDLNRLFEEFQKQKVALLKAELNKKNAKTQVIAAFKNMDSSLEAVTALESKDKEVLLSPEGNEMAYDLETLRPLFDLASGLMSAEDCKQARHEHQLNYPVVQDEQAEAITQLINKICR